MNEKQQKSRKAILRAFRTRGMTVGSWARVHGFEAANVYQVLTRWAGRTDRPPHGGLARQIIAQLRAELGTELLPEPTDRMDTRQASTRSPQ